MTSLKMRPVNKYKIYEKNSNPFYFVFFLFYLHQNDNVTECGKISKQHCFQNWLAVRSVNKRHTNRKQFYVYLKSLFPSDMDSRLKLVLESTNIPVNKKKITHVAYIQMNIYKNNYI